MAKQTETVKITASSREETGTRNIKQLRKDGWLPCVVYGEEGASKPIKINRHDFELMHKRTRGQNQIIDLEVEGAPIRKVLVREIQIDPLKDSAIHCDFLEISMTKKLKIEVEIRLVGEPVGVTEEGGIIEHHLRNVEVECLPIDIVGELELDISNLKIGDSLCVVDIPRDPKLSILTPEDISIVSIAMPREEEEEEPVAEGEEGEEGAEGEEGEEGKEGEEKAEKKGADKEDEDKKKD